MAGRVRWGDDATMPPAHFRTKARFDSLDFENHSSRLFVPAKADVSVAIVEFFVLHVDGGGGAEDDVLARGARRARDLTEQTWLPLDRGSAAALRKGGHGGALEVQVLGLSTTTTPRSDDDDERTPWPPEAVPDLLKRRYESRLASPESAADVAADLRSHDAPSGNILESALSPFERTTTTTTSRRCEKYQSSCLSPREFRPP